MAEGKDLDAEDGKYEDLWQINDHDDEDEDNEAAYKVASSSSSSLGSSSSLSDMADDASSSLTSCSSSSNSTGPLSDLSELMTHLPIKRGLSKFYEGKSQSFTSLSRVTSIEDLPKKETPYRRKIMKLSKSYGGGLDSYKSYTLPKPAISKKASSSLCLASKRVFPAAVTFVAFFDRQVIDSVSVQSLRRVNR
ncbi:hypothetical protein NMG60_11002516 [Bertholletia excelsa]